MGLPGLLNDASMSPLRNEEGPFATRTFVVDFANGKFVRNPPIGRVPVVRGGIDPPTSGSSDPNRSFVTSHYMPVGPIPKGL